MLKLRKDCFHVHFHLFNSRDVLRRELKMCCCFCLGN